MGTTVVIVDGPVVLALAPVGNAAVVIGTRVSWIAPDEFGAACNCDVTALCCAVLFRASNRRGRRREQGSAKGHGEKSKIADQAGLPKWLLRRGALLAIFWRELSGC